jgi:hypothetical protein
MVAASGPTGILAGRPPVSASGAQEAKDARRQSGDRVKHRHETDLYVRPSWTDAALALDQLEKVRRRR